MSLSLPTAVIVGMEMFGAERLAVELLKSDLRVIGVGEGSSLGGEKNFELWDRIPESFEGIDYVFDLVGEVDWTTVGEEASFKLGLVSVNNKLRGQKMERLGRGLKINWRVVEAFGVYGPGMEMEADESVEFVVEALREAVLNQNLVLPGVEKELRLMGLDDWVEGVMRTMFLRGTEGGVWYLGGERVEMEEVARVLIGEAKMTRSKVMLREGEVKQWEGAMVEENWEKLRWRPEIGFGEGIKETLQYFFGKIEEERRKKPVEVKEETKSGIKKKYEVMVEEDEQLVVADEREVEEEEEEEEEGEEMIGKKVDFEGVEEVKFNIRKLSKVAVEEEEEEEVIEVREEVRATEERMVKSEQKVEKRKWNLRWVRWVLIVGMWLGLIWWPIKWTLSGVVGLRGLGRAKELIEAKKYQSAEEVIERSIALVDGVDGEIDKWGINRLKVARNYQSVLKTGKEALLAEAEVSKLAVVGEKMIGGMFAEEEVNWVEEMERLTKNVDELLVVMGRLEARLKGDWSFLPTGWRMEGQKRARELGEWRGVMSLARKGMEIMPEMMGWDGKRRDYLVLLQNEMELRPGGGFIGSYGILSWENGRLLNFEIRDIYEADGQLKGHVEPPEEIKKYLGEAGWFMRDANWQASFPAATKDLEWFLEKETGRKVDGVIGVNLAVAKSVLGVVGEIYVPDFGEKVNKDNLYEQAEFYSESKFFPGSKQKASFLGITGRYLFEEIKSLPTEKWVEMTKVIIDKLEENEIQVVLTSGNEAKTLAQLGWDGSMYEGECVASKDGGCVADYLYVVEANVGVNKANYFVYRKMEEVVEISKSVLGRVVKINYENTAKNSNWPGGDYKNYMRVYLPSEVNLAEVSVEDGNKAGNRRVYGANELKIRTVGNKKEVGFLVVVPVGQRRTVELRYSSGIELEKGEKFSYLNYIQKQSGFGDTGMVTLVTMPDGWQPLQVQPAASVVEGKLLFNMKLNKDIKMGVELGR